MEFKALNYGYLCRGLFTVNGVTHSYIIVDEETLIDLILKKYSGNIKVL